MNSIFFFFIFFCQLLLLLRVYLGKLLVIVDGLPYLDSNCAITKRGSRTFDVNRQYLLVHHAVVGTKDATMKLDLIANCLFLLASSGIVSSSSIVPSMESLPHHPITPRPARPTHTRTRTTTYATTTTYYETPTPTTEVSIPYMPTTFDSAICSAYPEICRNAGLSDSAITATAKPNKL